ncbi:small vasohibin-binding protein isoform X1 [Misgurnus anguillicaudatus]
MSAVFILIRTLNPTFKGISSIVVSYLARTAVFHPNPTPKSNYKSNISRDSAVTVSPLTLVRTALKTLISLKLCCKMEPACRKDKQKQQTPTRGDRSKQKSAQQELKQRQRAEIYALNKVMTELEQQQFEAFCKQMQSQAE